MQNHIEISSEAATAIVDSIEIAIETMMLLPCAQRSKAIADLQMLRVSYMLMARRAIDPVNTVSNNGFMTPMSDPVINCR